MGGFAMRKLFLLLTFLAAAAHADGAPIGYVKTVDGEASVLTGGQSVRAEVGTPVHTGSVLRTGAKGTMGVTFKDETVMSFGPNTELTVDEYLYAPSQGKLKLASKLSRGSLNYMSGVIAKLQPDAVSVKTPTGTIGTRGTHFVVRVEE